MTARDRREGARRSTQKAVDFSVMGRVYRGSIESTSVSGVFITTEERFSEGQDIIMITEYPGEKRTGKIVRVTPHGIGVKFDQPGYERGGQND